MSTILIVDDNLTLAYCTARNLQHDIKELKTFTAASCQEARRLLREQTFSVAIVDAKLPDCSGIDLCQEIIRENPTTATVLISGEVPPTPVSTELFDFLLKPYEAEALAKVVRRALQKHRTDREERPRVRRQMVYGEYDRHKLDNLLAQLIAGLRAFERELLDKANDPESIRQAVARYVDPLCSTAMEVAASLPTCPGLKNSDTVVEE